MVPTQQLPSRQKVRVRGYPGSAGAVHLILRGRSRGGRPTAEIASAEMDVQCLLVAIAHLDMFFEPWDGEHARHQLGDCHVDVDREGLYVEGRRRLLRNRDGRADEADQERDY